jgi:hypothetical protein
MYSGGSRLLSGLTGTWGPRIAWGLVGVAGTWSLGDALDGRSAALRTTVTVGAWLVWGTGVVALVVPSPLGLTIMRMTNAVTCGAAVVSWACGAPVSGATFTACAVVSGLLVGGAEFGQRCVQASAYGDERRFLLRPPAAFLLPIAVAGVVWVAAVLAAPLLLGTGQWTIGAPVAVAAAILTWLLVPRFNVLSRRWLVFVPAGVVLHDHVVLAETLMVSRSELGGIELAPAGTEAADFTGPAAGHAVEVSLRAMVSAVLAPTKAAPRGMALHVHSFIIAPSRPGAVLRYWAMPPPRT